MQISSIVFKYVFQKHLSAGVLNSWGVQNIFYSFIKMLGKLLKCIYTLKIPTTFTFFFFILECIIKKKL